MLTQEPDTEVVTLNLMRRHPEVAAEQINTLVTAAFAGFRSARIRQFVPLLVTRSVEERLRQPFER